MIFKKVKVEYAEGAILAHKKIGKDWLIKKGQVLTSEHCIKLKSGGINEVFVAMLDKQDIHEDEASFWLAQKIVGNELEVTDPFTGRCNIISKKNGLLSINEEVINKLNYADEVITIATLSDKSFVRIGQVVATIKVIPFAISINVKSSLLENLSNEEKVISLITFKKKKFSLINTLSSSLKESLVLKTTNVTKSRIENIEGDLISIESCVHEIDSVSIAISKTIKLKPDMIIISGAHVSVDRADIIPTAIEASGGEIIYYGMPVDPGNLMLLGKVDNIYVLVLPGCARSLSKNGIDLMLEYFSANSKLDKEFIASLGVGGLLNDTSVRRSPRENKKKDKQVRNKYPLICAIILAAGMSKRMGYNKLLIEIDKKPLIRIITDTVMNSHIDKVIVVTGHEDKKITQALHGIDLDCVFNKDYAGGMASSIKAGIDKIPKGFDGALICLGDMPLLTPKHINDLIDPFDPSAKRSIGVPVYSGKRGNPVLWSNKYLKDFSNLSGDIGARDLINKHYSNVYEVEFYDTAVQIDLDTQDDLEGYYFS